MHHEIKQSGLADIFAISATNENELSPYIGQKVRYKRELLTDKFLRIYGTICHEGIFEIKEIQKTHDNEFFLRGYTSDRDFGRPIDPKHVELV